MCYLTMYVSSVTEKGKKKKETEREKNRLNTRHCRPVSGMTKLQFNTFQVSHLEPQIFQGNRFSPLRNVYAVKLKQL